MFGIREIKEMNAAEARRLSKEAAARKKAINFDIHQLLKIVYQAINHAVASGETSLKESPFDGLRLYIKPGQLESVWKHLRAQGYCVSRGGKSFKLSWAAKGPR